MPYYINKFNTLGNVEQQFKLKREDTGHRSGRFWYEKTRNNDLWIHNTSEYNQKCGITICPLIKDIKIKNAGENDWGETDEFTFKLKKKKCIKVIENIPDNVYGYYIECKIEKK